jgi:hypothetical protein
MITSWPVRTLTMLSGTLVTPGHRAAASRSRPQKTWSREPQCGGGRTARLLPNVSASGRQYRPPDAGLPSAAHPVLAIFSTGRRVPGPEVPCAGSLAVRSRRPSPLAAAAVRYMLDGHARGKVVITASPATESGRPPGLAAPRQSAPHAPAGAHQRTGRRQRPLRPSHAGVQSPALGGGRPPRATVSKTFTC